MEQIRGTYPNHREIFWMENENYWVSGSITQNVFIGQLWDYLKGKL